MAAQCGTYVRDLDSGKLRLTGSLRLEFTAQVAILIGVWLTDTSSRLWAPLLLFAEAGQDEKGLDDDAGNEQPPPFRLHTGNRPGPNRGSTLRFATSPPP
ncbi:hypothetical protein CASFOL_034791 [Castilleja foliolosa]|uniref:Uncharacterized protein n=1 Tax=Castilleja foliolosa TaxID=1961234 RepID=A0ABD3BRR7_9LAMI